MSSQHTKQCSLTNHTTYPPPRLCPPANPHAARSAAPAGTPARLLPSLPSSCPRHSARAPRRRYHDEDLLSIADLQASVGSLRGRVLSPTLGSGHRVPRFWGAWVSPVPRSLSVSVRSRVLESWAPRILVCIPGTPPGVSRSPGFVGRKSFASLAFGLGPWVLGSGSRFLGAMRPRPRSWILSSLGPGVPCPESLAHGSLSASVLAVHGLLILSVRGRILRCWYPRILGVWPGLESLGPCGPVEETLAICFGCLSYRPRSIASPVSIAAYCFPNEK